MTDKKTGRSSIRMNSPSTALFVPFVHAPITPPPTDAAIFVTMTDALT